MTDVNNVPHKADSLDEQLNHASEELITGDSDDPPVTHVTGTFCNPCLRVGPWNEGGQGRS
jgi:hypothetical protein